MKSGKWRRDRETERKSFAHIQETKSMVEAHKANNLINISIISYRITIQFHYSVDKTYALLMVTTYLGIEPGKQSFPRNYCTDLPSPLVEPYACGWRRKNETLTLSYPVRKLKKKKKSY